MAPETWKSAAFFSVIFLAALQDVPQSLHEAARVDGAGTVARFPEQPGLRVPNMGWCAVTPTPGARWLRPGHAYFAHSYAVDGEQAGRLAASGWEVLSADHGAEFVAGVRRGRILACQFHPELSGAWGQDLLAGWLRTELKEAAACLR